MSNPLEGLNVVAGIDVSGSMNEKDGQPISRFQRVQEGVLALTNEVLKVDSDGPDLVRFGAGASMVKKGANVDDVAQLFAGGATEGRTDTAAAVRLIAARQKELGSNVVGIIITDGAPSDEADLIKAIVEASNGIDRDEQLTLLFLQVGGDARATAALQVLDDDLVAKHGAKFDIVDVKTVDQVAGRSIFEVIIEAISD